MPQVLRMEDLSAQHPELEEDRLAPRADHLAHLRVFLKGLVVSPVAALAEAAILLEAFPVGIPWEASLAGIPLEAFPVAIPSVAVSLVVTEAADKS